MIKIAADSDEGARAELNVKCASFVGVLGHE
jgi:hypothetical protein